MSEERKGNWFNDLLTNPGPVIVGTAIGLLIGAICFLVSLPLMWVKSAMAAKQSFVPIEQLAAAASTELAELGSQPTPLQNWVSADKYESVFVGETMRVVVGCYESQQRITRSLRTLDVGRREMRRELADFTPEMAKELRVPWTLKEAIMLTCGEIDGQVVVGGRRSFEGEKTPASSVGSQSPSDSRDGVPANPVDSENAVPKKPTFSYTGSGSGKVVRAGTVKVTPKGREAYSTFEVQLKAKDGQESKFSGVDLEEKFDTGVFKLGDIVSITRGPKVELQKETDGKKTVTSRNSFMVHMMQMA